MRKTIIGLLLAAVMMLGTGVVAFAEDFTGDTGWTVEYDGEKITSNFEDGEIYDPVSTLQPGDKVTLTVSLKSSADTETNWWMSNKVLDSFEDGSEAANGAYTYILTYTNPNGTDRELFNSDTVGGENNDAGVGLHEATGALEDYFFLDTLTSGQEGTITLEIALDGETQGNDYQDTLADLQLSFAAEPRTSETPDTGERTNMMPWLIVAGVSGLILLGIAIFRLTRSRQNH